MGEDLEIMKDSLEKSAATIAAALFFLQREAQATGLTGLANLINVAVQEASDRASQPTAPPPN